mmetsp:Transcript_17424/g.31126  ORF Transcript_17424/g.31126 Transcript_17424/m.31126 type:complete len:110 (-) Transcript_17424:317-646(-)
MPVGGKLVLKGGQTINDIKGVTKKKKKGKKGKVAEGEDGEKAAANVVYEKEFEFEEARRAVPRVKNTPWGSSYSAPPEILHGYDRKVKGENAEERLDIRCATKTDKFCK